VQDLPDLPIPAAGSPAGPAGDTATADGPAAGRIPSARSRWPEGAQALAQQLHRSLAISERDWHALKGQRPRRAAEQIAASLVQLLIRDDPSQARGTAGREQAIALLEHALAWLKAEVSDPGCPSHGR
jgi:hypothetical protein